MKAILVEFTGEQELEDTIRMLKDNFRSDKHLSHKLDNDLLQNLISSLEKNKHEDFSWVKEKLDEGYSIALHAEYDDL